jgi:hypothetical protein
MKNLRPVVFTLFMLFGQFGLQACDVNEGPMEEAGEEIDEAADDASDTLEEACEDATDTNCD